MQEGADLNDAAAVEVVSPSPERHHVPQEQNLAPGNDVDPRLDPASKTFEPALWAKQLIENLGREGIHLQEQGIVFNSLSVLGSGSASQTQRSLLSILSLPFQSAARALSGSRPSAPTKPILHQLDGLLTSGELLLVLGRPGSGCTTLLKTLCGQMDGLKIGPDSKVQFRGIEFHHMIKQYRGEVVYNEEQDQHFPHLTVGETLAFAAAARAPQTRPHGLTRQAYIETIVRVVVALFGLSHTLHTKVGDDFVRGVSGGERKRVSIAEMFLSRARIGAWDNSTRGLDAATAVQFVRSLRLTADLGRSCHAVAAYQPSEPMYQLFDKVVVLYEGHAIYYGPRDRAVEYFEEMGWRRNPRQASADFLTSITSPSEREPQPGMENRVPRSAAEFAAYWKSSEDYRDLVAGITSYQQDHAPAEGNSMDFQQNHEKQQAKHARAKSPFLLSVPMQVKLCTRRAFERMRNDAPTVMSTIVAQLVLSLVIGSIFYNSPNTTGSFFQKGAIVFFAVLMNALITVPEIMQLYTCRPIVEKHARYAFAHKSAEALAGVLADLPVKAVRCSIFSIVLYFLTGLRREPGPFFIFYLFLLTLVLVMSGIFRSIALATRTVSQAMGMAGIVILSFVIYSGFMLPQADMHPWFAWIRWINPVFYTFEALLSNELHGRTFPCGQLIPPYGNGNAVVCASVGAVAGQRFVAGDAFLSANYGYSFSHLWRNYGILVAFLVFFHATLLVVAERHTDKQNKSRALAFRAGHAKDEASPSTADICDKDTMKVPRHTDVLAWQAVTYDIPTKEGTRRLLDDVNGWVKPGTLTALMGVSGAGKTTLLDVLAQRVSVGVVGGQILINGKTTAGSTIASRAGYVQQQDVHLETSTVREALRFSAVLRQPRSVPKAEKYQYVEEVIHILGMEDFAEAFVGTVGQGGLNVEQRKLLSIGVELAAKPSLLVFLDEPTSGLDSQSAWTICTVLRRLADSGQAVLATIHQPSALLFQQFDQLLFLAKGGKTVYFGGIGDTSRTVLDYFARVGARPCADQENPAEYILEMVCNGAVDWAGHWNGSPERQAVLEELQRLSLYDSGSGSKDGGSHEHEFAMPQHVQFAYVIARAFKHYFRQPEYLLSKFMLGVLSSLFISFSFWQANSTEQGFQNALFSCFLLTAVLPNIINQTMPQFVAQRSLYEVRERPSKVFSWPVFLLSQVLVELPFQIFLAVIVWACFYFPVFGTAAPSEAKGLVLLLIIQFFMYATTLAQMVSAPIPKPAVASMIAVVLFGLSFIFNGVMQPPVALPGFWTFMWRVSPLTYFVSSLSSTALHGRRIICSEGEMSIFDPPQGQTCGAYLAEFLARAPGTLVNPDATSECSYCPLSLADQYLAAREISWDDRWRDYGIFCSYLVFNIFAMMVLYYVFRVRAWKPRAK